jgi:hypothetical protein
MRLFLTLLTLNNKGADPVKSGGMIIWLYEKASRGCGRRPVFAPLSNHEALEGLVLKHDITEHTIGWPAV